MDIYYNEIKYIISDLKNLSQSFLNNIISQYILT